jgi:hypothetical protein
LRAGFPHSEILGSKPVCRLPEAYRRLPRPSSPVIAKASTTCTYSLDPITLNTLASTSSYRSYFSAWLPSPRLATRQRYNHQTQSIGSRLTSQRHKPPLGIFRKIQSITSSTFLKSNSSLQLCALGVLPRNAKLIAAMAARPQPMTTEIGGADRDRTDDPLVANQVLSQLSYSPRFSLCWWVWVDLNHRPHAYQACALTN